MRRIHLSGLIMMLAVALLLTTCNKEQFELDRLSEDIELEPRLVAPVVYGAMTMNDITELFDSADYVGEFEDGLIYVAYVDTLASVQADTAIEIPEINTAEYYFESDSDFDVFLPVPVGETYNVNTRHKIVEFNLEGDNRLDEVLVKNGSIHLRLRSTFRHRGSLTISSVEILDKDGLPFSRTLDITDESGSFESEVDIPSDSFTIVPRLSGDSSRIFMDFDLALINSGNPISPGEECVIQASFYDMEFYRVYGYFDTGDLVDETDTIEIPIYKDNPEFAAIELADPRINVICASSLGVPFEIDLDSMIALGLEGDEVPLTFNQGNTLEFLAPGMDQQGETVTTVIQIDNTTSNIDDFINSAPVSLFYSVEGRTTTTGDDTTHFVLDESRIDLSVDLLVPLDFRSSGYALSDTMEFSLEEDVTDTTVVKNAEVVLYTLNELPVELLVQVYFLDEHMAVLDSVFDEQKPLLAASTVNPEYGTLVDGSEALSHVKFPAEKLAGLEGCAYMRFEAVLTSSAEGVPFVKIYSHYELDFKLSILADVSINTDL